MNGRVAAIKDQEISSCFLVSLWIQVWSR